MDTRRLESFSDGVFAVAITVLVFNLLTIGEHGAGFTTLVTDAWPQYFAYAIGFLTVGIMWLNHHTVISHVRQVDRATLVLNIFLLMFVVAVPFPTALVADQLKKGGAGAAVVTYGVVMILMGVAFASLWAYLSTHQEALGATSLVALSAAERFRSVLRFSGPLVGYVAGTLVGGFWSPIAGLIIYGLIGVYYLFEHLPSPPAGDPEPEAGRDGPITG
jgi:uncharacterized membrane protein